MSYCPFSADKNGRRPECNMNCKLYDRKKFTCTIVTAKGLMEKIVSILQEAQK